MKKAFNHAIKKKVKINEVLLFKTMAEQFNNGKAKATFVEERHSHKGFITYYSPLLKAEKKIEISDLLFITYNKYNKEIRICFIQVKYKKRKYSSFINFQGNIYQWELLLNKYDISDRHKHGFPHNILNFSHYKTITAFGIFYYDRFGDIDFLFTIPEYINSRSNSKYTTMHFNAPSCICPNDKCLRGQIDKETVSTCSIDIFEHEMLKGRIGAPITSSIEPFIYRLLSKMRADNPENDVINEIILVKNIQEDAIEFKSDYDDIDYPNSIIVITNENPAENLRW